jgi:hypothetical protein
MAFWQKLFGKSSKGDAGERTGAERIQIAKQQTMHLLSKEYGFAPVFLEDIHSEEEANATGESAPLIYVWVRQLDGEAALVVSANNQKVSATMQSFMHREDPVFDASLRGICSDLIAVSSSSLTEAMRLTGAGPKEICDTACAAWEADRRERSAELSE